MHVELEDGDFHCVAGNFWGRKPSQISRFCGYSWKFSPWNLGHAIIWRHQRTIHESFLCENLIFHQFAKVFSHKSFPLPVYGSQVAGLIHTTGESSSNAVSVCAAALDQ